MVLQTPREVAPSLMKEVYYLDAYARIINIVNYTPVDKSDWRVKDYLDEFMGAMYIWANDNVDLMEYYKETKLYEDVQASDSEFFQAVLLAAMKRALQPNDQRQQHATASSSSDGPGLG
jgi:hypothetical protein